MSLIDESLCHFPWGRLDSCLVEQFLVTGGDVALCTRAGGALGRSPPPGGVVRAFEGLGLHLDLFGGGGPDEWALADSVLSEGGENWTHRYI